MEQTDEKTKAYLIGGLIAAGLLVALCVVLLVVSFTRRPRTLSAPPTESAVEPAPTESPIPTNPYGPGDFQLDGPYMTCLAGESVLGVDVSTYQQNVDWEAVRDAGVTFVMIRLGYRGSEQGLLLADDLAQSHYAGAKAAGLKIGAYFFSQSISPEEAREEAAYALSLMEGWELDMPLVYDWEYLGADTRTAHVDGETLTNCAQAFCESVAAAGLEPMIYFNPSMVRSLLNLEKLTDYPFWLAHYNDEMTFPYRVDMWQYTCEGSVPGIPGNVDVDLYLPYE